MKESRSKFFFSFSSFSLASLAPHEDATMNTLYVRAVLISPDDPFAYDLIDSYSYS